MPFIDPKVIDVKVMDEKVMDAKNRPDAVNTF